MRMFDPDLAVEVQVISEVVITGMKLHRVLDLEKQDFTTSLMGQFQPSLMRFWTDFKSDAACIVIVISGQVLCEMTD